jgi:FkbM family methyltransferase
MKYTIKYGILNDTIDVTQLCLQKCNKNIIHIPASDLRRAYLFTDPLPNIHKSIFIYDNYILLHVVDSTKMIDINVITNEIFITSNDKMDISIKNKLSSLQNNLKLEFGTFDDEYPEQTMVTKYLTGNEKVLEIGGNIGRNSLIISSILFDSKNLVVLESDLNIAKQLEYNRDINNLKFNIESSALSNRLLIQNGWTTIPTYLKLEGENYISTITLDELNKKYNLKFDTLVLDCEGAFYYILMDMIEILNNITKIIVENDYTDISHKIYVDNILLKNGFYRDYVEEGGWGDCYEMFYEVWLKK